MAENTTTLNTPYEPLQTLAQNVSVRNDCITVIFSEMEYLPWDNPDNIVSEEVETIVRRIRNNIAVLLLLIGGPANVINMAVFYTQGLKDRVNLCLFALALADELYLIMANLLNGEHLVMQFTTKERFGPVGTFLINNKLLLLMACGLISPILSAIIAIERCLCVFHPLKFQSLLRTRTMAVIITGVYIMVSGLYFITALRYRIGCVYDPESGVVMKTFVVWEFYEAHRQLIAHLDSVVFGVGLSGVAMIVVTTMTLLTIVKLRQAVKWRSGTSLSISPREVALTKMLIGNSILFLASIFPLALFHFMQLVLPEMNSGRRNHNFFLTSLWIAEIFTYTNASCNVFVYYRMGSRYRETFWKLFGRKLKQEES